MEMEQIALVNTKHLMIKLYQNLVILIYGHDCCKAMQLATNAIISTLKNAQPRSNIQSKTHVTASDPNTHNLAMPEPGISKFAPEVPKIPIFASFLKHSLVHAVKDFTAVATSAVAIFSHADFSLSLLLLRSATIS